MKAKYRLIILLLLLFIILLGFVIYFLLQDYMKIQNINRDIKLSNICLNIGDLISSLQKETNLSRLHLIQKQNYASPDLIEGRNELDKELDRLRQSIAILPFNLDGKSLINSFQKIFDKLDNLSQKRASIDSLILSFEELSSYSNSISIDLINQVAIIAQNATDLDISRTLFAQMSILHQRVEAGKEKGLLFLSLINGFLTKENYIQLISLIAKQEAFKESFFDLATPEQKEIYKSIFRGLIINDVNSIREEVLSKNPGTKLEIDPDKWWKIQTLHTDLLDQAATELIEKNNQQSIAYRNKLQWLILLTLLSILSILGLTIYLIIKSLKSLTDKLQQEIDTLALSSQNILAAVNQTSTGTAETATAVTETTTTVEELRQTAEVAADKAKHVSESSNETLKTLEQSEHTISETITGMNRIQDGMQTISQSIIKLSENSQTIGEIIDSVNDLAEQSHLLAVNAAIEAAKAGEQGKGFTVVAQEVRNLAEQSKLATVQVRNILRDIQNSTSAAVMATEQGAKAVSDGMNQSVKTNQSIRELSAEIAKVVQAASQIAVSSHQQLIAVDQVNVAMTNIKEASNQQVDHMRQIETGVRTLSDVSQGLKNLVGEYRF